MSKYYRINQSIKSQSMLVIGSDGTKLGVISREEALEKAQSEGLDVVEVAPNANPPVAKIIDFQKFRYEENKKEQAAKKHAKNVQVKELWLTPRIAQHDLNTRVKRAKEFLDEDHKIMFRVKFKGREMAHTNLGFELINKVFEMLGDKIKIERDPKLEGRSITTIVGRNR